MNFELFIAKRIALSRKRSFSRFIIKIAIAAVALSLGVMIITTATVSGFQEEISKKVFGFWGHIHIRHFDANRSYETIPISRQQDFYTALDTLEGFRHIQSYATKAGIIKTDDQIEGIVLKGVGTDYDWDFLKNYMIAGDVLQVGDTGTTNGILVSKTTADRMELNVGDPVFVYFIQQPPRARRFSVAGIFNTGLQEYDKLYALVDIHHIQKLNDWEEGQVGGFEVFIDDINELEERGELLHYEILGQDLYAETIKQMNPNIFDWLELTNLNELVILILMIVVAVINMITVLLILILERTNMIGILKAMGGSNWSVRKIFLYNAAYIVAVGLFWGNLIGIGLLLIQKYTGLFKLPEESYYVSTVPVDLNLWVVLALNIGTLIISTLILILPSYLITRIMPVKAIRFH